MCLCCMSTGWIWPIGEDMIYFFICTKSYRPFLCIFYFFVLFGCCALLTAICFVSESFCSAIAQLVILFQLFSFRVTMIVAVLSWCLVKTRGIELCWCLILGTHNSIWWGHNYVVICVSWPFLDCLLDTS